MPTSHYFTDRLDLYRAELLERSIPFWLNHALELAQYFLDFAWTDLVAPHLEDVVLAADEPEKAVCIDPEQVAGMQPGFAAGDQRS